MQMYLEYELKYGVFEDWAKGYAIEDYKKCPNMIGVYQAVSSKNVQKEINDFVECFL